MYLIGQDKHQSGTIQWCFVEIPPFWLPVMRYLHKHLFTFKLKFFCRKRGCSHKKKQAHVSCPQHTCQHGSFCPYFLSMSTCLLKVMYLLLLLFWLGTEPTWAKYSTLPVNYTATCIATSKVRTAHFTYSQRWLQKTKQSMPQDTGAETTRATWKLFSNKHQFLVKWHWFMWPKYW